MAGTAVTRLGETMGGGASEVDSIRLSLNKLVDDAELVRAAVVAMATKLDLDAGVTDTNYAAGATVAAINPATDLLAYKVNR